MASNQDYSISQGATAHHSMSQQSIPLPSHRNYAMTQHSNQNEVMSGFDTTTSYEKSRQRVSSIVVSEEFLGELPVQDGIKYIEVPVIEEIIKTIPKKEIIEVEKRVPKYEYEYVDVVREVPQIHYIDKEVEKTQIQEVIRTVAKKEIIDMPREVIRTVPRIENRMVEKIVEVPGQVIEVPKPYTVENRVAVTRWQDKEMPVIVAQTIRPIVVEGNEVIDVDVFEYEPQVIPVDVHVAKPVASQLIAVGATSEMHQLVTVPAAQYNTILRSINVHLGTEVEGLPYIKEGGIIPFLHGHETPGTCAPQVGAMIQGYNAAVTTTSYNTGVNTGLIMNRGVASSYQNSQVGEMKEMHTASSLSAGGIVPSTYPHGAIHAQREGSGSSTVSSHKHGKSSTHNRSKYSFGASHHGHKQKKRGCAC